MADELRERFLKIYANIPLSLRKEIIAIIDKEPVTWSVAYVEIFNGTKKGEEILKRLDEMKLI